MTNPIKYSSVDFQSVINDINNDPVLVDKPEWFKRIWAGARDVAGVQINAMANLNFLRTAFTRQSVVDLLALIDYAVPTYQTAYGTLIFHLNAATVTFPVTFSVSDLIALSQATLTTSTKQFEARAGITVTAVSETFTADAGTDLLTVARVYTTGEKVQLTTTTTLPAGLSLNTDYYIIYASATTIYLATTAARAAAGLYIDITDAGTGVHTIVLYSFQKTCYQQASISAAVSVGTSDGATAWQTFLLPDKYILDATLTITINSVSWTNSLSVTSTTSSKHYKLIHLDNGLTMIMFGNGTYGEVPGNYAIMAQYAVGGGATSNVGAPDRITIYGGTNSNISTVTNPTAISGGSDEQTLENAKIYGPMMLQAQNRDVTVNDSTYLALNYPGVMQAVCNRNAYGVLSQQIVIIPAGGGAPGATLISNLTTYLTDRTIMESVYTEVIGPTYVTETPIATVNILSGYTWATVQSYFMLGLRLLFSECTPEIINAYNSTGGVAAAIAYINTKWSTTFGTTDYASIAAMLTPLVSGLVLPASIGATIASSQVTGYLQEYIPGVNYFSLTAPTFPISLTSIQMTTDSVISGNITQV
jgi:hypothetical protein